MLGVTVPRAMREDLQRKTLIEAPLSSGALHDEFLLVFTFTCGLRFVKRLIYNQLPNNSILAIHGAATASDVKSID